VDTFEENKLARRYGLDCLTQYRHTCIFMTTS